jgi:outer membrane protein OmpA-like peptidoglycan-associated protein
LSAWKLMGLAGLFAGLLVMVTLFYTTQSPSNGGSAPRPGGVSESARADMDQSIADKYSRVPVETKAGLHRETALNDSATQRQLPDSSVIEKPTTAWEQSQPQKQLPTPEPVQAGLQEQQDTLSEISDLEEQIRQSGLLIERLAGGRLKVNLSSDGLFDFDSAEIKDKAQPALDGLAESLSGHDGLMVQIVGHTDSSGAAEYNLHLSRRRAGAVADYLITRGFPGTSIQSEGRGDRDTRLDENANTDPRLKRRVEIYITRIEAE